MKRRPECDAFSHQQRSVVGRTLDAKKDIEKKVGNEALGYIKEDEQSANNCEEADTKEEDDEDDDV